jgi:hypothetical protein
MGARAEAAAFAWATSMDGRAAVTDGAAPDDAATDDAATAVAAPRPVRPIPDDAAAPAGRIVSLTPNAVHMPGVRRRVRGAGVFGAREVDKVDDPWGSGARWEWTREPVDSGLASGGTGAGLDGSADRTADRAVGSTATADRVGVATGNPAVEARMTPRAGGALDSNASRAAELAPAADRLLVEPGAPSAPEAAGARPNPSDEGEDL